MTLVTVKSRLSWAQKLGDMGIVVVVRGEVTLGDQKKLFRGIDYSAAV